MVDHSRIQRALEQLVYLPSLQDQAAGSGASAGPGGEPPAAPSGACRPWDRQDLNRRLQTFKASTWFCKPEPADAVACALHGWTNSGPDALSCECCGAGLSFKLAPGLPRAEQLKAAEAFAQQLDWGHAAGCPWAGNACDAALASYPPVPQPQVLAGFRARLAEARQLTHLPPLAGSAVATLAASHRTQLRRLLAAPDGGAAAPPAAQPEAAGGGEGEFAALQAAEIVGSDSAAFGSRARVLAACGWSARLLPAPASAELRRWDSAAKQAANLHRAVLHCACCGARVGLWALAPPPPAAEPAPGAAAGRGRGPAGRAGAQAQTMIASLAQSIAGGPGPHRPLPGPPAAPAFGSGRRLPVFRSLARARAAAAAALPAAPPPPPPPVAPQDTPAMAPAAAAAAAPPPQRPASPAPQQPAPSPVTAAQLQAALHSRPARAPAPAMPGAAAASPAPAFRAAGSAAASPAPAFGTPARAAAAPAPVFGSAGRGAATPGPASGAAGGSGPEPVPAFGARSCPAAAAAPARASSASQQQAQQAAAGPGAGQGPAFGTPAAAGKTPSPGPFGSREHLAPAFGRQARRPRLPAASPPTPATPAPPAAPPQPPPPPPAAAAAAARRLAAATPPLSSQEQDAAAAAAAEGSRKRGREAAEAAPDRPAERHAKRQAVAGAPPAAEAAAARHGGAAATAAAAAAAPERPLAPPALVSFDPLRQHRPFCCWVLRGGGGGEARRCGWRWTLESLAPGERLPEQLQSASPRAPHQRGLDSAARLRQAFERVHVIRK